MKTFALTIRKTRPIATVKQAYSVIRSLQFYLKRAQTLYPNAEFSNHWEVTKLGDKYNVHTHSLVTTTKHVSMLRIATGKGYHSHIKRAHDADGWLSYCQKDDLTPDEIITIITLDLVHHLPEKAFNSLSGCESYKDAVSVPRLSRINLVSKPKNI